MSRIIYIILVALSFTTGARAQQESWEPLSGPLETDITNLDSCNEHLFCTTGWKVFRSSDGEHWEQIKIFKASRMLIDHGRIFLAGSKPAFRDPKQVIMSTDNGDTWSDLKVGDTSITDVKPFGESLIGLYRLGSSYAPLAISKDHGTTWERIAANRDDQAQIYATDSTIFLFRNDSLFYSRDTARTWSLSWTEPGLHSVDRIWRYKGLLEMWTTFGTFVSIDGGKRWSKSSLTAPVDALERKNLSVRIQKNSTIVVGGQDDERYTFGQANSVTSFKGMVYIGTRDQGIVRQTGKRSIEGWVSLPFAFRSSDDYQLQSQEDALVMYNSSRVYYSTDIGLTWSRPLTFSFASAFHRWFAPTGSSYSTDFGTTWTPSVTKGMNGYPDRFLRVGDRLYWLGINAIESLDSGSTWHPVDSWSRSGFQLFDTVVGTTIFEFSNGFDTLWNLRRSTDYGRTWTLTSGPKYHSVISLLSFRDTLFAKVFRWSQTGDPGLFLMTSADLGDTWQQRTMEVKDNQFALHPLDDEFYGFDLLAPTKVYFSNDAHAWDSSYVLPAPENYSSVVHKGYVFRNVSGDGLSRRVSRTASVKVGAGNSISFTAYPNPARDVVAFAGVKGAVIVRDVMGRTVHSSENLQNVDVSSWPRGVYFASTLGHGQVHTARFVLER